MQFRFRKVSIVVHFLLSVVWSVSAWPLPVCTADSPVSQELGGVDFERDVQPIFREHCHTCHGADVQEADLRLDQRDGALAGGTSGPAILAGESDQSLLIRLVTGSEDQGRRMPPEDESEPLSDAQVAILRAWIDQGASWPRDHATVAEQQKAIQHWSFQPLRRPSLPGVANEVWCRNPVDRFVLARLESHALAPVSAADRRSLVRRVAFDLLGLPPSPDVVAEFVDNPAVDAYEQLLESMLSDPHYGERWGRHWLDLVRYADTNGYEIDGNKPFAWKYRDYVIAALNDDKPYDRFVLEQLAGDELRDASTETVLATGYLRVGPWDAERGASVQESELIAERYNELDDMVSTTSMVFLGLTMGCARCHSHKFDPLTARDYYSMAAIFHPLERSRNQRIELFVPAVPPSVLKENPELQTPRGYFLREVAGKIPETRILKRGNPAQPGAVVAPAVPAVFVETPVKFLSPDEFTSRRRLSLARWIVDSGNPLTARVIVNRVWQHHFGRGLVRTSSDFGLRGDKPTHPLLLDWLAHWFSREGGWSLKKLHRLIMTSSTYRMSKRPEATTAGKAVDNRLLWHFPYRRLEMEAIRDSMLAVSGRLSQQMYGPGMYPQVPAAARRSGFKPSKVWKPFDEQDASRRTVYAFLKRTFIPPMFDVLDFCDTARSADRREITTVAPQSLTLFNGDFVNRQARHFADRLEREAGPVPEKQIERAYQLALGRLPDKLELEEMRKFLVEEAASLLADDAEPVTVGDPRPPLDDLVLWLDATSSVEATEDNVVLAWHDKADRGNHARPKGDPEWVPAGLKDRAVVRFDGQHDWFALSDQVVYSPRYTILAVVNDTSEAGARNLIGSRATSEDEPEDQQEPVFDLATVPAKAGGRTVRWHGDEKLSVDLKHPRKHFLLTAVSETDHVRVFHNTSQIGVTATSVAGDHTHWVVGRHSTLEDEYWKGDVAEILVYHAALDQQRRARVWRYLGQKYGLFPVGPAWQPRRAADAQRLALSQMCRVIFNLNEFVYPD